MKHLKILKSILNIYFVLAVIYGVFSLSSHTGLADIVETLQMKFFGSFEMNINAVIVVFILLLPVFPIAGYLKRKGVHTLISGAAKNNQDIFAKENKTSSKKQTLRIILIIAVAPIVIAMIGTAYFYGKEYFESHAIVYTINLNESLVVPDGARIVKLTGLSHESLRYQMVTERQGSTNTDDFYTPLTPQNWSADQPIYFFLHRQSSRGNHDDIFYSFSPKVDSLGYLKKNSLPTYVLKAFQEKNFNVSPTYYVFEENRTIGQGAKQSIPFYMFMGLGVTFSMTVLVGGGIGLLIRHYREKKS